MYEVAAAVPVEHNDIPGKDSSSFVIVRLTMATSSRVTCELLIQ